MRYQTHENAPYGWELMDTQAVPWRTMAANLRKEDAAQIADSMNMPDAQEVGKLRAQRHVLLMQVERLLRAVDRMPGNNPMDGLADEVKAIVAMIDKDSV